MINTGFPNVHGLNAVSDEFESESTWRSGKRVY